MARFRPHEPEPDRFFMCVVSHLVDVRNDPRRHNLAVALPIGTVLDAAAVIVATFPVDEQNGEVHGVEVRDDVREA